MRKSILKTLSIAFVASVLATSAFFMSCSSDSDSTPHEHTFATTYTTNETHHWYAATCEHKDQVKDKVEHSFGEWSITTPPTEESDGSKKSECKTCHYVVTEIIPSLEHNHKIATEWTCDEDYHWHAASCGREEHNEGKLAHTWIDGDITKAATETEDGEQALTCECGATSSKLIPALGHNHEIAKTYTSDETHHWYAADCGREEHNEGKAAHNFETSVKKAPTCTEKGINTETCSECNYSKDVETEALGHKLGTHHEAVAGTCKTKGTIEYYDCTRSDCEIKLDSDGKTLSSTDGELAPENHEGTATWKKTAETHIETYDCCDAVKTEESGHTWNDGVIGANLCSECGYIIIKPEGFVEVAGVTITGEETWTPESEVFVKRRQLTIPTLIVCDHEVTRGEFKAVMGTDPSTAKAYNTSGTQLTGDAVLNNPVNYVNWYAAIAYCNKLSIKENLTPCYSVYRVTDWATLDYNSIPTSSNTNWDKATCNFEADGYRLPTEAEWEWLARGGENYTYAGSNTVGDVAWYTLNTNNTGTREVKTKQKNGYGLYDMSGNVWEWCWDWRSSIYNTTPATGYVFGDCRVKRGGSVDGFDECAVAYRSYWVPDYRDGDFGFRVVRSSSK